ncbi:MAG: tyrosine-type recombinase/integrase [Tenericutes bacterium]|nr:tyrosine-type recombinase/integrase [Mycoplasmatota bacterium]
MMKMSKAIEDFRKYVSVTKAKGTQDYYKYYLDLLSDELGHLDSKDITNNTILNYIIRRKEFNSEVSNATLNKHITTLKTVLKYACNIELKFAKLKERKKIIPTISQKTYTRIFDYYKKHMKDSHNFRNYVFLKLLLDTGLRLSEITSIKIRDIDFDTNSIHIKVTKTDVDRYVCFTESTKKLLIKFVVTHDIKELLFFDFKTGSRLTTSTVESFIYRLKIKLKITENITPHKWRHTFATNFLNWGGDLETLRLLLGHSNLKTTQKYLHLSRNDIVSNYTTVMRDMD